MAVLPWTAWDLIISTPLSKVAQGRIPLLKYTSLRAFQDKQKVLESSMDIAEKVPTQQLNIWLDLQISLSLVAP